MKNLVIVESPTKARTLSQFLGKEYQITASMGHVRDLPRGEFGVDVENGFAPQYVIPKEKIKAVNILAKEASVAEKLWLATDPDREGEAIAWNLLEVISQKSKSRQKDGQAPVKDYSRVVFHEITKDAISEAFKHPRKIDDDLVEAQQARRVLDRLVGYKLSPLLWKKVKSGLSAGRVQSVALRVVVDREREIEAFKSEEYWEILVEVSPHFAKASRGEQGSKGSKGSKVSEENNFVVKLIQVDGEKAEIKNKAQANKIVSDLQNCSYKVSGVKTGDVKKYPHPPFITSTLQQSAANRLGFTPGRTMRIAQDLYEKGLITYMRTDSVHLSDGAVAATRKFIEKEFGGKFLPASPRHYKVKSRLAQEAHEAIRPTDINFKAGPARFKLGRDAEVLYDLIWKRMVACQMVEAVVGETQVDVTATVAGPVSSFPPANARSSKTKSDIDSESQELRAVGSPSRTATRNFTTYLLRANGQKIKFDGWYKVYTKPPISEQILPDISEGEDLDLIKVNPLQKFTEPPPRFTEATLIKELEKNDIGRPSTYAPTISTLYERAYIEKLEGKKIGPTPIGETTVDFLVKHFPEIVDLTFTADMENDLDLIAQGQGKLVDTMEKFWGPFEKKVTKVAEKAEKMKVKVEESDEKCEKCGKPMVIRYGRFGKFLACSGFPECKNTKTLSAPTGLTCPNCGGNIVMKKTRRGRSFWGCDGWPKCKFASWQKPVTAENTERKSEDT